LFFTVVSGRYLVNTNNMQKDTETKLTNYFKKFCPIGEKQRREVVFGDAMGEGGLIRLKPDSALRKTYENVQLLEGETPESHLFTHYQELCRKITPGYGNYDRAISEKNILSLKTHGFGVYESDNSTVGKLVYI